LFQVFCHPIIEVIEGKIAKKKKEKKEVLTFGFCSLKL